MHYLGTSHIVHQGPLSNRNTSHQAFASLVNLAQVRLLFELIHLGQLGSIISIILCAACVMLSWTVIKLKLNRRYVPAASACSSRRLLALTPCLGACVSCSTSPLPCEAMLLSELRGLPYRLPCLEFTAAEDTLLGFMQV